MVLEMVLIGMGSMFGVVALGTGMVACLMRPVPGH